MLKLFLKFFFQNCIIKYFSTVTESVVMMMSELNIWISVDIKIFNIEGRALTKLESSFIKSHIALSQFLFLFTNATQDLPLALQSLDNL